MGAHSTNHVLPRVEASGGHLGTSEALLGLLGVSGAILGPLESLLGASWEPLGASWEPLGDYLGSPWKVFGASLGLLKLLESRSDGLMRS